jgi:hypothetical protein
MAGCRLIMIGTGLFRLVACVFTRTSSFLIALICQCRGYVLRLSTWPIDLEYFDNWKIHWPSCGVITSTVVGRTLLISELLLIPVQGIIGRSSCLSAPSTTNVWYQQASFVINVSSQFRFHTPSECLDWLIVVFYYKCGARVNPNVCTKYNCLFVRWAVSLPSEYGEVGPYDKGKYMSSHWFPTHHS